MTSAVGIPGTEPRAVAVGGLRLQVRRLDPPRRRRTTPALLLHGVPQTGVAWREVAPELARDRTVIVPDLPGLGGSERRGPYDVATVAAHLAELVLHEVDGPVDVVGHDWGGSLALALAGARPDLVRRLVVANAPYRRLDLTRAWHVPLFALPGLPEGLFAAGGRRMIGAMLDYAWVAPRHLDPAVREHYLDAYASRASISAMLGYYRAATRPRLARAALRTLGVGSRPAPAPAARPEAALVLWGARDPVLPLPVGEAVVTDLGPVAEMLTVPGAGHFVVEEAPDVAVPAIGEFLRRGEGRRRPRKQPD